MSNPLEKCLMQAQYNTAQESLNYGLLVSDTNYIRVAYEPGKIGDLFKTNDPDIAVGDYVNVPSGTRWCMTTGRCTQIGVEVDMESAEKAPWIVGAVDTRAYEQNVQRERTVLQAIRDDQKAKKTEEMRAALLRDHENVLRKLNVIEGEKLPPPSP